MVLDIEIAWRRLNDAICQWERETGRSYTAILVPHSDDEPVKMTLDGKPVLVSVTPERALEVAMASRGDR